MALKNSTNFRVPTRELQIATDPKNFTAEILETKLRFDGIDDNKMACRIDVVLKIGNFEVLLTGEPMISLNHFELQLTGNSAKLTPEEAEKIAKRIQALQEKLAAGVMPTEDEMRDL